ncbi:MAG: acryloyl-CoA reductase [Microcella sp.]|uniref:acrylyl-CoA reductase family protein n=1 Tax=Microcella sp. TaxID=1913979 RepID=UPI0024C7EE32|nr:acryloyl-CoA reductase [Microcella sp.]UYN83097.1 MAG: acryloyl-CoA reductase [Microcella sp.]
MTRGWLITRGDSSENDLSVELVDLTDDELRPGENEVGDVMVDVSWSSLNYKDALAFAGNRGVVRVPRLVPGIDVVGTVAESTNPRWSPGDRVLLNGAGAGETRHGGLAQRAVLDGSTLIATPTAFTDAQAAGIGTAGFTAMLAVLALERHGVTEGDVLVTGASGGLGSFAIALLARAGFSVTAVTGRRENEHRLRELGATTVIDRAELDRESRPLESQRHAGVIDSVGGRSLATALAMLQHNGAAVACGNAASASLETTVMPFILRGVTLIGGNSSLVAPALREQIWRRLSEDLDTEVVDLIARPIELDAARDAAGELLAGTITGRLSVRVAPGAVTQEEA